MTPDFRHEYTLRCNRFALLFLAGGVLLLLGASFAGGYYFGRQAGSGQAGETPWAALVVPYQRQAVTVAPPGLENSAAGANDGAAMGGELSADSHISAPAGAAVAPASPRLLPVAQVPGAWCIQLASRGERAAAEREVAELTGRGLQARVEIVTGTNGPRYLVRLGEFTARAEAEQYAAALENRGLITDFIVMEK